MAARRHRVLERLCRADLPQQFVPRRAAHDRLADHRQALRIGFGGKRAGQTIRRRRAEPRARHAPQQPALCDAQAEALLAAQASVRFRRALEGLADKRMSQVSARSAPVDKVVRLGRESSMVSARRIFNFNVSIIGWLALGLFRRMGRRRATMRP